MPAAIAIPLIIGGASAGAQVYAAKKGSDAAKGAAKTQEAGADRALALQRQMYEEAQPRYQPYQDIGRQALGNLPSIAGNVPYAAYGQSLSGMSQYGQGQPPMPSQGQPPRSVGRGQTPAAAMSPQGLGARVAALRQTPGASGRMVTLQAPDGTTRAFPEAQAQRFIQAGAKVVGS